MQRPGGPTAKLQPSPEGLGPNSEDDLSAVGAALNEALTRSFNRQPNLIDNLQIEPLQCGHVRGGVG